MRSRGNSAISETVTVSESLFNTLLMKALGNNVCRFAKGRRKAHLRKLKTGQVTRVRETSTKVTKKPKKEQPLAGRYGGGPHGLIDVIEYTDPAQQAPGGQQMYRVRGRLGTRIGHGDIDEYPMSSDVARAYIDRVTHGPGEDEKAKMRDAENVRLQEQKDADAREAARPKMNASDAMKNARRVRGLGRKWRYKNFGVMTVGEFVEESMKRGWKPGMKERSGGKAKYFMEGPGGRTDVFVNITKTGYDYAKELQKQGGK